MCVGTTVLIKMGKARYIWVTAVPMVFVGAITLTGSYELFFLFIAKAGVAGGSSQAFVLYLDAALVAVVALLALVILTDSIRQWYGYLVQGRPYTTTEVLGLETVPNAAGSGKDGFNLPGKGCC